MCNIFGLRAPSELPGALPDCRAPVICISFPFSFLTELVVRGELHEQSVLPTGKEFTEPTVKEDGGSPGQVSALCSEKKFWYRPEIEPQFPVVQPVG